MIIRLYILLLLGIVIPTCAAGQREEDSTMKLAEKEWNFGIIREVDGPVSHTFRFTNTGRNAFIIDHIGVSCGCTTPKFTNQPVLPGKQGEITIEYNPKDRPGAFVQDIIIASNGMKNRNKITIRGEVVARPRRVEDDYPFDMGAGLRFSISSLNYRYVGQNEKKSIKIGYINTSDKEIRLEFETPAGLNILSVSSPQTICAGCRGEITATYDLTRETVYGRFSHRIYPIVNGKKQYLPLSTTVTLIESTTGETQRNPPVITIEPPFHNFGNIKRTDRPTKEFKITNDGRRSLIIRWVGERSEAVRSNLKEGTVIPPGRSVGVTVTIDPSESPAGVISGSISVISNDPVKPVREIRVAATLR